jgi:hypothetical protein
MSTIIVGSVQLTPLASVDTSNSNDGHSIFTLLLPSTISDTGNIIQYEYWIYNTTQIPSTQNGFLPVETSSSQTGISNQVTISIPSANNSYNDGSEVKVRAYVGSKDINSEPVIQVSDWSNTCPIHNSPPQPGALLAFLIRGTIGTDKLYVQIPENSAYIDGEISFVVSYSFIDAAGDNKWVVSPLMTGWDKVAKNNYYLLPEIDLDANVESSSHVYVAVNAVYKYDFSLKTYYSVSEISVTGQSSEASYQPPALNTIVPNDHYYVYDDNSQVVQLSWTPPPSSLVPNFKVEKYQINFGINGVPTETLEIADDVSQYAYDVSQYVTNVSDEFSFTLTAVFSGTTTTTSPAQTLNSFLFSEAVTSANISWVNLGIAKADGTPQYDILTTFSPPISFGTPGGNGDINYIINIIDDNSVVKATQTVAHDPAVTKNTVYFPNVDTSPTGIVEIYVITKDTNFQDDGITNLDRAGPAVNVAYESSELGTMTNFSTLGDSVSFEWISNNPFDRIGTLFFNDGDIKFVKFETNPQNYTDYEVLLKSPPQELDNLIYEFTFKPEFFINNNIPENVEAHMCVSNSTGIENFEFTVPLRPVVVP